MELLQSKCRMSNITKDTEVAGDLVRSAGWARTRRQLVRRSLFCIADVQLVTRRSCMAVFLLLLGAGHTILQEMLFLEELSTMFV